MVGAPSLIKTMAAGAGLPSAPGGSAVIAFSASEMASPVAVPPPTWRWWIAASTVDRSAVGATSIWAFWSNATKPSCRPAGSAWAKVWACAWAAASRVGATSSAVIDAEVSRVRTTVARCLGVRTSQVGRAKPSTRTTSAPSSAIAGTCRCHPGRRGATEANRSTLVNRTAAWRRLRSARR